MHKVLGPVDVIRCMKFVPTIMVALAFPVTWFVYHYNIIKNTKDMTTQEITTINTIMTQIGLLIVNENS